MTDKETVTTEIDVIVGGNFKAWRVGLSHDPRETKRALSNQKQDVSRWQQWKADSLADAKGLERACVGNGMRGVPSGILSDVFPTYLFIF